ncbi:hypothetical protein [Tahibacter soli]|uniref:DUF1579 domain-containing protein n=1 Tax=Tahibacter soli TaxID=2983605 RepID=A0A9X3YIN2_9GAMM|nr:hypothetical protein [Tahibacter soli]MDC8011810.1 hypothetical protein [Tahibacter soli]
MRRLFAFLLCLFAPLAACAQSPAPTNAPANGFDFLIGEWSLDVRVKVSGLAAWIHGTPKLTGTLRAWRTADGIDDELRIVDASGNPRSTTRSRRTFDAATARWSIASLDPYDARDGAASARLEDGEMRVEGSYRKGDARTLTRTRYYAIAPDAFRLRQDRSTDDGATWDEGAFEYDAKRIAPAAAPR